MKIYVLKNELKGQDGLYHHYYIEKIEFSNRIIEHQDIKNQDGTYQRIGDFMIGEALFNRPLMKEVTLEECVHSVAFDEA